MSGDTLIFVDCTLRDGGYYNNWDFDSGLINRYLEAMVASGVDHVEAGLRTLHRDGFRGACAYTSDNFLASLKLPASLSIGVMVNASELLGDDGLEQCLSQLFPVTAEESPVDLVRIACHAHEFRDSLAACHWLKDRGYRVGFNLMQIADRELGEIDELARLASAYPLDVLYFADSMGSLEPDRTAEIVTRLRRYWHGALGIHTHDNLRMALQNTLAAMDAGVTWVDATVTGMGRGPGNARTEELAIEVARRREHSVSLVPLMQVIRTDFRPLQEQYGWGTNPYYYLAGIYGIHPTYIQEMLQDSRYDEEDILAVIEHLRAGGGKKFSFHTLDAAREFYRGGSSGSWSPAEAMADREVLLLGTGPGVARHQWALEQYVRRHQPVVLALNTQSALPNELIDFRVACHPVRLLADCEAHAALPGPLVTPWSSLPEDVRRALAAKQVLDFGLAIEPGAFRFGAAECTVPASLVAAYALALTGSGGAARVLMAGFDGYAADDPRNAEMNRIIELYRSTDGHRSLVAVTPTCYDLAVESIYGLI